MTKRDLIEALAALNVPDDAPILLKDFDRDGDCYGVSEITKLSLVPVEKHIYETAWSSQRQTCYRLKDEKDSLSSLGIVIEL